MGALGAKGKNLSGLTPKWNKKVEGLINLKGEWLVPEWLIMRTFLVTSWPPGYVNPSEPQKGFKN